MQRELEELDQADAIHPLIRPGTSTPDELIFFEMLGETLKDIYALRPDEEAFARQVERTRQARPSPTLPWSVSSGYAVWVICR